jgi:hypothetical protein
MVKLDKEKKTIFVSNNWIKFFLADFLLAAGLDCTTYDSVFIATFCIVGAIGLFFNLIFSVTRNW